MLEKLLEDIRQQPEKVEFEQVLNTIEQSYHYQPTRFTNGRGKQPVINEAGQNEGSCKIFAFADLNQLSAEQTLHCFGDFYRNDVLKNPDATNHPNIRAFMQDGWAGVHFDKVALRQRKV